MGFILKIYKFYRFYFYKFVYLLCDLHVTYRHKKEIYIIANLKMKTQSIIITFILFIISINCISQQIDSIDQEYYQMYKHASGKIIKGDTTFQIISTSPYYVVINVTNLKTGSTKEICTEYPYIEGAISKDSNNSIIDEQKRDFKFYSDAALNNVDFFNWSINSMDSCLRGITVEMLMTEWKNDSVNQYINFHNKYSGECQTYYAFLLFKNGIMSTRGCLVGSFSIVTNEKRKKEEKEMEKIKYYQISQ